MTVTIEINANKKEIEKYFEAKVYSKSFKEIVEKKMNTIRADTKIVLDNFNSTLLIFMQTNY